MRVLILGFSSLQAVNSTMEKLIEESQCFLFTVACGGTDNVAYDWAQKVGATIIFSQAKTQQKLAKEADYLVMKLEASSPQWMKNLMMAWKKEGKHGTIIRG